MLGRPSGTLRRSHELRTDGIEDRRSHDAFDLLPVRTLQRPARDTERRLELIEATAAPERNADPLIEHPTHRQLNHTPAVAALSELIELPHGVQILRKTRRLKFRVDAPQIVAVERAVRAHAPAEQPPTQGSITESRNVIGASIRQDVRLNGALEEIVGRLQHVQWGHLTKALHFGDREIAYADGPDLSCLVKRAHGFGGFLDRDLGIGPVDLVDIDIVGAESAQRIIDFLHDPLAGRVAINLAIAPFQSGLRGNDRFGAHALERLADDLLGYAEAIHRCGIDQVDVLMQRGPNRGD